MQNYSIVAVVAGFDLDDEFQNAGLECLNYGAVVGRTGSVVAVDADVPANSPVDAVLQLKQDLLSVGVSIVRLDLELVAIPEIAERVGVSRETVRLWTRGKRRSGFPSHHAVVGDSLVWSWATVHRWLGQERLLDAESMPLPLGVAEGFNGAFAQNRSAAGEGWLAPSTSPIVHLVRSPRVRVAHVWQSVAGQYR